VELAEFYLAKGPQGKRWLFNPSNLSAKELDRCLRVRPGEVIMCDHI